MSLHYLTAAFGSSKSGLATVGYRLHNADGTASGSRITAGVAHLGSGTYGAQVTVPDSFTGYIRWDTGEATPLYAAEGLTGLVAAEHIRIAEGPLTLTPYDSGLDGSLVRRVNGDGTSPDPIACEVIVRDGAGVPIDLSGYTLVVACVSADSRASAATLSATSSSAQAPLGRASLTGSCPTAAGRYDISLRLGASGLTVGPLRLTMEIR